MTYARRLVWTISTLALLLTTTLWLSPSSQGNAHATKGSDSASQVGKWIPLFDGKSKDGWKLVPADADSKWEVKDGQLCGSGKASMLVNTSGPYINFRVRADVMINDKGNSGLYFRAKQEPGFTDGYEAQINATHSDPIKTGSLYTMVHLYKAAHKPDEYFAMEVECKDLDYRGKLVTAIKVSVNNEVLYETLDYNRTFKSGYIAFQQHDPGSKVCIRKVELMQLPDTKP